MAWGQLAGIIGAGLGGALLGGREQRKGREAQARAQREAIEELLRIELPGISEQEIRLLGSELQGELQPEYEQAMGQGPSAFEDLSTDEYLASQQRKALEQLSELSEGGLTEADAAAARDINREVSSADQARQKALLQEMAQRGTLGSGAELVARLEGQQLASGRAAQAGDSLIQQAQHRALQALSMQGDLAGNIRGQDFQEQSRVAGARDAIDRFNTANRQQVQQRNVMNQNQAQRYNLGEKQRLADRDAGLRNQQHMYNQGLIRRDYLDRYGRAQDIANVRTDHAATSAKGRDATAELYGGIGSSLADIIANYRRKEDDDGKSE